ncbi:hypothetical protein LTK58_05715 [Klebsiella quasipneumoniae subsp. quasipneumoniae]|nr:hypothetical protein [Klebsiella quasipneumoniae]MCD7087710.1 hypothetical protein [Klebsiella quasipneumoniae subsp. quasipneumoniae]
MKPAPGAEPVRMYKSPYGGKYGVWRLTDCVPMRAKRSQTEKQRLASTRLGLQARMKSERGRFAMLAHILPERRDYSIIFPYGWEKKQLTREMRRMFPRKTGRRVLIMLDEYHKFFDSREKP